MSGSMKGTTTAKAKRIDSRGSERTVSISIPVPFEITGSFDRRISASTIDSGKPIRQVPTKMNRVSASPPHASSPM